MTTAAIKRIENQQHDKADLVTALEATGNDQQYLFDAAKARKGRDEVYLRAVIELSNHCRQTCNFCGMRAQNKELERFRIQGDGLTKLVDEALAYKEVDIVHFSFGEDLKYDFKGLGSEVKKVYAGGKNVTLVLGELREDIYRDLHEAAGGNPIRYTLKLETTDSGLFAAIKPNHTFEKRLGYLNMVRDIGFQPCTGIIVGLPGQTTEMLANDLTFLTNYRGLANVSASEFRPSPNSPYETQPQGSINTTLNFMALLRVMYPDTKVTIPSSSSLGSKGQEIALRHFADIVSIHLIPESYRDKYLIYEGPGRHFGEIQKVQDLVERSGGVLVRQSPKAGAPQNG